MISLHGRLARASGLVQRGACAYGASVDATDPLIPPPSEHGWFRSPGSGDDPLEAVAEAISDYVNFNALVWPARDASGQLKPPPVEHVLDRLARSEDLVPEEQALTRPAAGTVAVIGRLPDCDLCGHPARYDGQLTVNGTKAAAFACPTCYDEYGSGALGATGDVYLMTWTEVPSEVRRVCDELTAQLGRPSLWV